MIPDEQRLMVGERRGRSYLNSLRVNGSLACYVFGRLWEEPKEPGAPEIPSKERSRQTAWWSGSEVMINYAKRGRHTVRLPTGRMRYRRKKSTKMLN